MDSVSGVAAGNVNDETARRARIIYGRSEQPQSDQEEIQQQDNHDDDLPESPQVPSAPVHVHHDAVTAPQPSTIIYRDVTFAPQRSAVRQQSAYEGFQNLPTRRPSAIPTPHVPIHGGM
jgi:hypothetical protein